MSIDLHTHSRVSDGTQNPADLVREAAEVGLSVIAVTDHDTTAGWAQAIAAGRALGVRVLPGVEISSQSRGRSVHLLGYGLDATHPTLVDELAKARSSRLTRMRAMVERMASDGIPITYDEVLAQVSDGATLGRPHLADALVAKGVVRDRDEAFEDILHNQSPYYVGHYAPSVGAALALVHAAGGAAVLAHPFPRGRGYGISIDLIERLAAHGLDGIEVEHPDHDPGVVLSTRALAARLGLVPTGSSDYHGTGKVNRLGQCTTSAESLAELEHRIDDRSRRVGP